MKKKGFLLQGTGGHTAGIQLLFWHRGRRGHVREGWRTELGQMRALCSRCMRIDLNSEVTWNPLKTFEPEGLGSELALGNCDEPAAGRGGPGREAAAAKRTGWAVERPSTLLLSLSLEPHVPWQLSSPGRCRAVTRNLTWHGCFQKTITLVAREPFLSHWRERFSWREH